MLVRAFGERHEIQPSLELNTFLRDVVHAFSAHFDGREALDPTTAVLTFRDALGWTRTIDCDDTLATALALNAGPLHLVAKPSATAPRGHA